MASLTTPLSVRLSEEDTAFLAGLEMDGAVTASEKIRGLIRQARQRADTPVSFSAALTLSHDHLATALRAIRTLEADQDCHSDVVVGLLTTTEELLALVLAAPRPEEAPPEALVKYEARMVDCAARMMEQILRWSITPTAPAYDPLVVARRMESMSELMKFVSAAVTAR